MSILELSNVSVSYGPVVAVHDVSLSVPKGKILAIIGANGAGKSSTLKAIIGLIKPRSGEIRFEGERIDGLSAPDIVARGIALSPEGRRVFPRMSVMENLTLGGYLQRDKGVVSRTLELIFHHFPRLKERRSQAAGSLSGGEQQMLAIGRALMAQPRLLLLDEPSLGLAPIMVQEVARVIVDINKSEGISVALVEQNAKLALKLSHEAVVLESGEVALGGTGEELLTSEYVQKAYLGV
ncbi:ABC transporter ATP-binding protein [Agaricicola taiwanensis]|uniref:ABC transporter ATP-binding protein n=1 Tax=Agaricicola taiwanensis TaxID=591372 RepID=A0A8J2VNS3_9RHOB|nr:ABC transporter ATP-binding protein [Agaricicola taiwanensis]GGE34487.1 ABC transporter ATP-binding protein [Agaricicola taiwanensis]